MIVEVRVQHARFVSCFSGFRLWSGGFRVEGLGFRVMRGLSSGFMGFRVLGHEVEWNPSAFRRPSGSRYPHQDERCCCSRHPCAGFHGNVGVSQTLHPKTLKP